MTKTEIEALAEHALKGINMVPDHLRVACMAWVRDGRVPGDFLQAVIRNDLADAVCRADELSLAGLRGLVRWFYNCAPDGCWGSADKAAAWVAAHQRLTEPTGG